MVHNLIPYDMVREDYQESWIRAAAQRGVTEELIQTLLLQMDIAF